MFTSSAIKRLLVVGNRFSEVTLLNYHPFRLFSRSLAPRNDFDELKKAETKDAPNRNTATFFDIDNLIANSPGLQDSTTSNLKFDNFAFGSSLRNPREVAKSINMSGPAAGRSVAVRGNLQPSISVFQLALKRDRIRLFHRYQLRFIRPAKFQKIKKMQWWKQNFRQQFQYLIINIKEAKRRGY